VIWSSSGGTTISTEPIPAGVAPAVALGEEWRAARVQAQARALPSAGVVLSCPTTPGMGGLGRHFNEIRGALERQGSPPATLTDAGSDAHERSPARGVGERLLSASVAPLARVSPAARMWAASVAFDSRAARELPPAEHLIAFNGTALAQLHAAKSIGYSSTTLVSANSHFANLIRLHARAYRQYPIEAPWATHLLARNLREYEQADQIHVSSQYVWESFLEAGIAESRLVRFPLTPDPRFTPPSRPLSSSTFDVVYVGSLTVHKGVPLLIDAVRRLPFADLRLVLVGGWGTRGMRRFLEDAHAKDSRISAHPGDPLGHLQAARLCVHPAYEDGFAYAPTEAMACGVPVIVSEDTGMKELLGDSTWGKVVPTGDLDALTEAIEAAYLSEPSRG
jgi:glycosyltransferase involved in cell wall biosynthesis